MGVSDPTTRGSPQKTQVYYYDISYLRTSSSEYTTNIHNIEVQLTNNSKQKQSENYSKYEEGNTLLLKELVKVIDRKGENGQERVDGIVEDMKRIIVDTIMCARVSNR